MSLYCYVQLFLFGLLYTGAMSTENATCTTGRAQSNIDLNQVYGDWFVEQVNIPANATLDKRECLIFSVEKINETTFASPMAIHGEISRLVFSIENAENAGTWHVVGGDGNETRKVIYLSADGSIMVTAECLPNRVEPHCVLMGKQLPINSEKIEEAHHAVELAGIPRSHCHFTWKSEAICLST